MYSLTMDVSKNYDTFQFLQQENIHLNLNAIRHSRGTLNVGDNIHEIIVWMFIAIMCTSILNISVLRHSYAWDLNWTN
jgi:hypothetical protein